MKPKRVNYMSLALFGAIGGFQAATALDVRPSLMLSDTPNC